MHDTGCLGLVHWDDPEGWNGEGGGRRVQDGEHMYTCGRLILIKIKIKKKKKKRNISDWSTLGHVPILDQSLWVGGCRILGLHAHFCGGRSGRWGYWLEGMMGQQ